MKNEKRNVRGYKVKDSFYKKAMRRAQKEEGTLSNLLECIVVGFAEGMDVHLVKVDSSDNSSSAALNVFDVSTLLKPSKGGKK